MWQAVTGIDRNVTDTGDNGNRSWSWRAPLLRSCELDETRKTPRKTLAINGYKWILYIYMYNIYYIIYMYTYMIIYGSPSFEAMAMTPLLQNRLAMIGPFRELSQDSHLCRASLKFTLAPWQGSAWCRLEWKTGKTWCTQTAWRPGKQMPRS